MPAQRSLSLLEITNHPVCAAKERGLFIRGAATPPLKGGEWIRLATNHSPSAPDRNLWDSSDHNQFSIFICGLRFIHTLYDRACSSARQIPALNTIFPPTIVITDRICLIS